MKTFNYNGSGQLAFTHQNHDYVVQGQGPHNLPDESDLVSSLVSQELLVEVGDFDVTNQEISTTKRIK